MPDVNADVGRRFDPLSERGLSRLREAVKFSIQRLKPFRDHRLEAIKQFVGMHYSDDGTAVRLPVNLIELAIHIYSMLLASGTPQAHITTDDPELLPRTPAFQMALNRVMDRIGLGDTLNTGVKDALFTLGAFKVGIAAETEVELDDRVYHVGQPFVDVIDFQDWFHDMSAKSMHRLAFCGNCYRLPLDVVREAAEYDDTKDLKPTSKLDTAPEGDGGSVEDISRGNTKADRDEYRDYIELMDVYLPQDKILLTIPRYEDSHKPIRVQRWEGPAHGPYRILAFQSVPGQTMPLAPVAVWRDMHDLANILYRKLGKQAVKSKSIVAYDPAQKQTATEAKAADDGDFVATRSPQALQEIQVGKLDQGLAAFTLSLLNTANWQMGNLDALGGLGPNADTLGQEQIVQESASRRLKSMQRETLSLARGLMEDIGYWLWTQPVGEYRALQRVEGTNIDAPVVFGPDQREGTLADYKIDVVPYSLQMQTPAQKLAIIDNTVERLTPFLPLMQEQGVSLNLQRYLELRADYSHVPELREVFEVGPPAPPQPQSDQPRMQPNTNRTYTRVNKSAQTEPGTRMMDAQKALAGASQE